MDMVCGSLPHITYFCLQGLLEPNLINMFLFANSVLLFTPNFMAWWVKQQFMGDSSGCMFTWFSMFKCSVSSKPKSRPFLEWGILSTEESRSLLQNSESLHCDSPRLAKASKQHPYLTLAL